MLPEYEKFIERVVTQFIAKNNMSPVDDVPVTNESRFIVNGHNRRFKRLRHVISLQVVGRIDVPLEEIYREFRKVFEYTFNLPVNVYQTVSVEIQKEIKAIATEKVERKYNRTEAGIRFSYDEATASDYDTYARGKRNQGVNPTFATYYQQLPKVNQSEITLFPLS